MKEGLNYCWPTPILIGNINNKLILEKTTSYILSNFGGKISATGNLEDDNVLNDENISEFTKKIIYPAFNDYYEKEFKINLKSKKYHFNGWVTGYGTNFTRISMLPHNHSGAQLTSVFYLMSEENNKGGRLFLNDPRTNANRGYKDEYNDWFKNNSFSPKTGQYIIFPGFLYHTVENFSGKVRLALVVDFILY